MLFIYQNDNYKITFIQCVDYELYHEATLCMKKSHWEKYMYKETSKGEGEDIFSSYSSLQSEKIKRTQEKNNH